MSTYAVLLEAVPPRRPWLLGGYPGSTDLAKRVVRRMDGSELDQAWLLTGPEAQRRIDPAAVLAVGNRSFPDDYEKVTDLRWPARDERQILWKPRSAEPNRS